jgi:hypothetical protein
MVRFSNGPFWLWDETSCSVDTDSHKLKQLKGKLRKKKKFLYVFPDV